MYHGRCKASFGESNLDPWSIALSGGNPRHVRYHTVVQNKNVPVPVPKPIPIHLPPPAPEAGLCLSVSVLSELYIYIDSWSWNLQFLSDVADSDLWYLGYWWTDMNRIEQYWTIEFDRYLSYRCLSCSYFSFFSGWKKHNSCWVTSCRRSSRYRCTCLHPLARWWRPGTDHDVWRMYDMYVHMRVSLHGGTPKWIQMVCWWIMENIWKSHSNGWLRGTHISVNLHVMSYFWFFPYLSQSNAIQIELKLV